MQRLFVRTKHQDENFESSERKIQLQLSKPAVTRVLQRVVVQDQHVLKHCQKQLGCCYRMHRQEATYVHMVHKIMLASKHFEAHGPEDVHVCPFKPS